MLVESVLAGEPALDDIHQAPHLRFEPRDLVRNTVPKSNDQVTSDVEEFRHLVLHRLDDVVAHQLPDREEHLGKPGNNAFVHLRDQLLAALPELRSRLGERDRNVEHDPRYPRDQLRQCEDYPLDQGEDNL